MADIPVNASDAVTVVAVTVNGQTAFDYDFRADFVGDLKAEYRPADGDPVTVLVGGVDFTASGLGTDDGGTITLTSFVTVAGDSLAIYRDITVERNTDYTRDLFSDDINAEQDRIFMILQEIVRDLARGIRLPLGYTGNADMVPEDGTVLGWDGINLVNLDPAEFVNAAGLATAEQGAKADTALQPADLTNTPLAGTTTATNLKMGDIQNLWDDGVVNQIVSHIKGTSYVKSFLQGGTGLAYLTTIEPLHRTQGFSEVNVYDFDAPDGYKGLTQPVSTIGHAHQYVIGPKAFDKIAGNMFEIHDKSPNGGEHFGIVIHYYQHADRKDAAVNDPDTGGFFPIDQVADSWPLWILGSDMGHHANMFLMEFNIRNEWGMRPETNNLHSEYMPQTGLGFQVITQMHPDFSQYHITRGLSIVPSNSWGNTIADPTRFVGFETGIFVSGYAKYGLVFGKSIPYANPHNPGGSATSPTAITFASNDLSVMSFWYDGAAKWTLAKLDSDSLGILRNSDGKHFWAAQVSTGRLLLGNASAFVDMNGDFSMRDLAARHITLTGDASVKNLASNGRRIEAGGLKISPLTGFTEVMTAAYSDLTIDPAGTLATGTVTFPAAPVDGQIAAVSATQTVTALTVNAAGGIPVASPPTTITAQTPFRFRYRAAQNAWYRAA